MKAKGTDKILSVQAIRGRSWRIEYTRAFLPVRRMRLPCVPVQSVVRGTYDSAQ